MPKQIFKLRYKDEKEEQNLQWARENVKPWAKPANDQRVQANGTSGALGSIPLPGPLEGLRAFWIRKTR